jgi:hypothetical protein
MFLIAKIEIQIKVWYFVFGKGYFYVKLWCFELQKKRCKLEFDVLGCKKRVVG